MNETRDTHKAGGPSVAAPKDHERILESYRTLALSNLKKEGVTEPTEEQIHKKLVEMNLELRSGGYY